MSEFESFLTNYYSILLLFLIASGFIFVTMLATHFFGPKHKSKIKDDNFECGIEAIGDARVPFSVKYFIVALLFVIFDVEIILMYPWAVLYREFGLEGFFSMLLFVFILALGYFHIIKKGAFKWE